MSLMAFEGAQCFRQRLLLSTVSGKPIKITKVRVGDERPGFRDYEASLLRLLDKICDGSRITINETGTTLRYTPGQLIGGEAIVHDCPPTRSISYFLEALILLAPFSKVALDVTLRGVTADNKDVSVDSIKSTAIPILDYIGVPGISIAVKKRGFAPAGGGEVHFQCPVIKKVRPFAVMKEGKVKRVRGVAYTMKVSPQFAARMVDVARGILNDFLPDVWIYTDHGRNPSGCPGYGMSLVCETVKKVVKSADAAAEITQEGETGVEGFLDSPEAVGKAVAERLLEEVQLDGVVDTQHQYIPLWFAALAEEDAVCKIRLGKLSPHTVSLLRHIRDFLGVTFQMEQDGIGGETVVFTCCGVGMQNMGKRSF
mmetsp:Transcript_34340/g.75074  ORF Transcript_34340/g.75074 Transcript_34340/m.75074 type:complete len:369 (+) Transcript_34340:83-1189(+)